MVFNEKVLYFISTLKDISSFEYFSSL